jgi:hypothetical protein
MLIVSSLMLIYIDLFNLKPQAALLIFILLQPFLPFERMYLL